MAIAMTHRCCQVILCKVCSAVVGKRYATELPGHSLARNNFCLDVDAMNRQEQCCHSFGANSIEICLHYISYDFGGIEEGRLILVDRQESDNISKIPGYWLMMWLSNADWHISSG